MQAKGAAPPAETSTGSVEGTEIWRVVTMSGVNRFTGAVEVRHASRLGTLFFDEGRVVHAETAGAQGETAFRQILRWPGARCTIQPDAAPVRLSITRSLAVLLVELKGLSTVAEPTPEPTPPASPAPAPPARVEWLSSVAERIGAIPGVLAAMLQGSGGPVGRFAPETPEGEAAATLGSAGRRLGEALGLGRLVLGVARGTERLVLLLTTRDHQLTVLIRADEHVDAVQAKIRALLTPQS